MGVRKSDIARPDPKLCVGTIMLEPKRLKEGKKFHKKVQSEWIGDDDATGHIIIEKGIIKPSGRKGRVDVFVDPEQPLVAIAEVKDTDWDDMTETTVRRNIRRQVRQIWDYIESQLSEEKDVCPAVIFSKKPKTEGRIEMIETLFHKEGIQVVWDDETIVECRKRNSARL